MRVEVTIPKVVFTFTSDISEPVLRRRFDRLQRVIETKLKSMDDEILSFTPHMKFRLHQIETGEWQFYPKISFYRDFPIELKEADERSDRLSRKFIPLSKQILTFIESKLGSQITLTETYRKVENNKSERVKI